MTQAFRIICPRCNTSNNPHNRRCYDCWTDLCDEPVTPVRVKPVRWSPWATRSTALLSAGLSACLGVGGSIYFAAKAGRSPDFRLFFAPAFVGCMGVTALTLYLSTKDRVQDLWRTDMRHPRPIIGISSLVVLGIGVSMIASDSFPWFAQVFCGLFAGLGLGQGVALAILGDQTDLGDPHAD